MSDAQYRIKMVHLNYLNSGILPWLMCIAVIFLTVAPAILPLVCFKFVSQVSWDDGIHPVVWKQRAGANLAEFLKHNPLLFPTADIPVWSLPGEITFYCCQAIVFVGCTPELSFPITSNLGVCLPKATVRTSPGCRASSQRYFLSKRGFYAFHGSEKKNWHRDLQGWAVIQC